MRLLRTYAVILVGLCAVCLIFAPAAAAHPMGNFAICHYARIEADPSEVHVHYVIDMAEIPALSEKEVLDGDHSGAVSPAEKSAYLAARAAQLASGVTLTVGGAPAVLTLTSSDVRLSPGAGGLQTLKITLNWSAATASGPREIGWQDRNYPSRTGWKEIVAANGDGEVLSGAAAFSQDRSRGLSVYPRDIVPPQDTEAHFSAAPGTASASSVSVAPAAARDATPRDLFTQAIATRALTPGVMLLGLLIAFVFGAFHALSPGHGKTMVAAYLVGTRGTSRHAVTLGLIVTITHTLGVFALGLVTLFASRYIVPEKLYPVLSAVSGLAVFGVGVWLLVSRLRGVPSSHHHDHEHNHAHDHRHGHGPGQHTHGIPDGPITLRSLLALGISGGIVPCPSALVVLLSAVALHRIVYGMVLITAFSVGLASVLIVIGLMVVSARHWFSRFPAADSLLQRLPVISAAAITLIGIMLIIRAVTTGA